MQRMGLMLATMVLALLIASGVALAEVFHGDGGDNTLIGTDERDSISGGGGGDLMRGLDGPDRMRGEARNTFDENGADTMYGGRGEDVMNGEGGVDHIYGGSGDDYISSIADNAVDYVDCGGGNDSVNRSRIASPDRDDVFVNCENSVR